MESIGVGSCVTCRLQKAVCDGVRPRCNRCGQAGFDCLWQEPTQSDRARRACLPCRRRKIRCAGPSNPADDESTCPRCQRLSLVCNWTTERQSKPKRQKRANDSPRRESISESVHTDMGFPRDQSYEPIPRQDSRGDLHRDFPSPSEALLGDKVEIQQILRTYFGTVHYFGFLTFVHEPTLFRLLDHDRHPKDLVTVMVACTLRLAGNRSPDALARADALFQSVLHRVQRQVYEVYGAIELMTVVLLRQFQQMKGQYSSAWMLWGNAVKMMQFLSLHTYDEVYSRPHTIAINPLLSPEALRRLAWAVFFLDSMGDAGRHGVHTVTEEAYHIQLPADETAFARGIEVRTEPLRRTGDVAILSPSGQIPEGPVLGVSAHIIKTSAFRRRILHFKSRIKYMTSGSSSMLESLDAMEAELREVMAELPPDLVYSDNNLYIHPERRTAFILLHALRHNCFIMLAETRLIVCSKDPALQHHCVQWMKDRVRHAYPVASVVSDALRLGIVCDPFIGALAYTSIEVLLFDTPRLAETDASIDPKSYELTKAIKKLLEVIRVLGTVDDGMKHMRIEACRRIMRRGLGEDILTQEDLQACQTDRHASGEDDDEFDFRLFRWHRLEQTGRIPNAAKNPWAAEAILDIDARPISRVPSRRSSPRPTHVDASAVSDRSGSNVVLSVSPFDNINTEPVMSFDGGAQPVFDGTNTLSYTEGTWSFEDNFVRFMEQAGYASVNEERLPWMAM